MRLVVVSPEEHIAGEAELVNELFRNGMSVYHLRKPEFTALQLTELVSRIDKKYHSMIAIHSHHEEVAPVFDLIRLHFTSGRRKQIQGFELGLLSEKGFILSTSVHEISEAENLHSAFSYCFLGPVFDSISKKNYSGRGFRIEKKCHSKIFAIGGITPANLYQVKELNFDGAALCGTIWKGKSDPVEQFWKAKAQWVLEDQLS